MRGSFPATAFIAMALLLCCKPADKKPDTDTLAAEFCDCIKSMETKLSDNTKKIIHKAASSDNPAKSIETDVKAMGIEINVLEELENIDDMKADSTETGTCINKLEQKYKDNYSFNEFSEERTFKKIINELDGKMGCDLTVSLMKLSLKMKKLKE